MLVEPADGVEGDVAVLASRTMDIDTDMCLNFHLFLVLSNSSSEDRLRINLASSQSPQIPTTVIHEIVSWSGGRHWQSLSLTLPSGSYVIQFEYTMGIPYRSTVAIDNVQITKCAIEALNRNHTYNTGTMSCLNVAQ